MSLFTNSVDPNAYEIVYTLSENDFYYIFSKDVPDALVSAFQQALDAVRDQRDEQGVSDYERIIYRNEAPYRDSEDPGLYAFVYDTNLTIVAHADNIQLVGENFKGKTDVTGKPFRDEILEGALKNGTGWVDYVYMHPVQTNLYYKTTYYRLTQGSDGKSYIVCSGNYKNCQNESNNQSGQFGYGELYIFAYNTNGTTLALPFQPELIGTDLSGLQDPYGVNYTRVEIFLAKQGGGFLFYHYYNPARNMTLEPKMSYVQKLDIFRPDSPAYSISSLAFDIRCGNFCSERPQESALGSVSMSFYHGIIKEV